MTSSFFFSLLFFLIFQFFAVQHGFSSSSASHNPDCKAKRYLCDYDGINQNEVCVNITEEQEKYHILSRCNTTTKTYCDSASATYDSPVYCTSSSDGELAYPYEDCEYDSECYSGSCVSGECVGLSENEYCSTHLDCDNLLYCAENNTCLSQKNFGDDCSSTYECVNNCVCNNGQCAFYYSIDVGNSADNEEACGSGYIDDGYCAWAPSSLIKGDPCSSDGDCVFVDSSGTNHSLGVCTCGYNGAALAYCTLAQGDSEFETLLDAAQYIMQRNINCHTLKRFGPCKDIYDDEYLDYWRAKMYYEMYPEVQFNDICVKEIYTWDYWKYYSFGTILEGVWRPLAYFCVVLGLIFY